MAIDILQRFLSARLFDVSSDDTRVQRIREAAADFGKALKETPERIAACTMVGIDREVGPDEPIVLEAVAALEVRWQSYAGAFSDGQLPTVARAIVLQGLANLVQNDAVAAAVSSTSRNLLPLIGSRTDEAIWTELMTVAEQRLYNRSMLEWGVTEAAGQTPSFETPAIAQIEPPGLNRKYLEGRFAAAAGPSNAQGTALEKANSNWPNNGPQWAYEFPSIAAGGVAAAVDSVAKKLVEELDPSRALAVLGPALKGFADAIGQASAGTLRVLERRSRLLWWKEALFSPGASVSYRDLDPALAAALAAVDASAQMGPFAPRMAESFLSETVRGVDPELMCSERPLATMASFVATVSGAPGEACRQALSTVASSPGRTPLSSLIGTGAEVEGELLAKRIGLPTDLRMSAVDLALWLFRELQASAANPPVLKRRRGARQ